MKQYKKYIVINVVPIQNDIVMILLWLLIIILRLMWLQKKRKKEEIYDNNSANSNMTINKNCCDFIVIIDYNIKDYCDITKY